MNTLATYLQPEIKSILDSVHPFLAAHKSYFPKDSDPTVIHFLAMATALANNLSPAFQSSQWDAWKIEDPTRMFKLLGLSKPRFNPSDTFPGKTHAPSLPSLPLKRNHFQVDHYLFLCLAHTWYPQVLNFDILVNWCQLDVANLIYHVHPFLVAHVEHFPDDEDPLALQFPMTVTVVASNLGPCFFDPDWTLWLEQDCRHLVIGFQNFKSPFPGDLHFPGSQHLVIQSDSLPNSKATLYTSNLPFFQLSRAGVYPIHLPVQLFSNFYIWPDMDIPAT
ncbi:hypothetical protein ARMGADRAFT_1032107 [Armillaria gallica]|uniref:Uncharacterized protein n=1 Tax=Armillaria gallica TaxID=47427 RepID=A0A2H3D705_ARMGA|nr:hypothetical protein ARMGADRAFT_1032107 [Armillaria gallica]